MYSERITRARVIRSPLVRLFILKELSLLPMAKWQNLLHLITCSRHYYILAKTRGRMTTAITFSRQNDAVSRVSNTQYWENLIFCATSS